MLKKLYIYAVISITLFCFEINVINAYDFVDSENEGAVNETINEIFDMKDQYEDLVGGYEENEVEIFEANSNSYWWPIGSQETTESNGVTFATGNPETLTVTSPYGYRDDPLGRTTAKVFHNGLDISGGSGLGNVNIIAVRDGVVVYPYAESSTNCPFSTAASSCGGGYGNYVIIQHSDGNYTLYAHLHANTITVKAGDTVKQGQVIGKMGSSGNSTGAHLHFEVRVGANDGKNATVDPLTYISAEYPRLSLFSSDSPLIQFIHSWEGTPPQEGDNYIAFDDGYGNLTIGWGVVPMWHEEKFESLGYDVSDIQLGDKLPKSIVDKVEAMELQVAYDNIVNMLSRAGISLKPYQIDALVSRCYNYNVNGFVEAYKEYGDTDLLYDNYMSKPITSNGEVAPGLVRRRNAEWEMFHNGIYQNNS